MVQAAYIWCVILKSNPLFKVDLPLLSATFVALIQLEELYHMFPCIHKSFDSHTHTPFGLESI